MNHYPIAPYAGLNFLHPLFLVLEGRKIFSHVRSLRIQTKLIKWFSSTLQLNEMSYTFTTCAVNLTLTFNDSPIDSAIMNLPSFFSFWNEKLKLELNKYVSFINFWNLFFNKMLNLFPSSLLYEIPLSVLMWKELF